MIKKLLDRTFWKFIFVGMVNTLIGTAVMFSFYNLFHFSYWVSSAANYIVGSVVSYFLNKNFTFRDMNRGWKVIARFIINITLCYLIAYGAAKSLAEEMLRAASKNVQENGAMLVGMSLFVILNYIGQRFFVFKKADKIVK